jgi:hypothetical protein
VPSGARLRERRARAAIPGGDGSRQDIEAALDECDDDMGHDWSRSVGGQIAVTLWFAKANARPALAEPKYRAQTIPSRS